METPYIAHILAKKDILQKAPQKPHFCMQTTENTL